jgi:hypothetical protein
MWIGWWRWFTGPLWINGQDRQCSHWSSALGWLQGWFLAVEGPIGRGGRVDPHHGNGWWWGDAVWLDSDERCEQPIFLDGRLAGARSERAWDAIQCAAGRGCSWTRFIGRGRLAEWSEGRSMAAAGHASLRRQFHQCSGEKRRHVDNDSMGNRRGDDDASLPVYGR